MYLTFTIPGEPQPKGRPEARCTKVGHPAKMIPVFHSPPKTAAFQKRVARHAQVAMQHAKFSMFEKDVALALELTYFFKRRPSVKRRWMTVAPDVDNLEKIVLDGMEGVVYPNDKQVVSVTHHKAYAKPPDGPRIEVSVWQAGQRRKG